MPPEVGPERHWKGLKSDRPHSCPGHVPECPWLTEDAGSGQAHPESPFNLTVCQVWQRRG